jgi:uncharacterized protein
MAPEAGDTGGAAAATPAKREVKLSTALVLLTFQALAMTALGGLLWTWSGRPRNAFVTFSVAQAAQGLALAILLILAALAIFRGFPRAGEALVRMQAGTYAFLGPRLTWPGIVAISLCAGVGEEALFRGGVQTYLEGLIGPIAAIAVSSALFAAVHLGKPIITMLLFVIGVVFGLCFWLTESLLTVMIGHTLYDIWALRYLHREFLRLGLVRAADPSLANPTPEG